MAELIQQTNDKLVLRKMIPASREEVFAAWTDSDSMRHWMCPGDSVTAEAQMDVRVGGSFRILMKGPKQDYDHTGEYRVIDRPSKLSFTWISKGTDLKSTIVTVELFEREGATELILTHENFPSPESVGHHAGGWGKIADLLADYLQRQKGKSSAQSVRR
ncbi:MAG: hypothetical protein JWO48_866 [Bryobacterales bacterium]|nr:hypothetical protein [Bryobacterales bacterium]